MRKTFMKEFDPQYKCLVKEVVGMKHASDVGKIQKEWILLTSECKSFYWKEDFGMKHASCVGEIQKKKMDAVH